mgnify:CR=1 FL=1
MSIDTCEQTMQEQKTTNAIPSANVDRTTRNLFAHQTGQVLVTLGTLFKHVPPFNETIEQSTGETLITIGKKLKSTK